MSMSGYGSAVRHDKELDAAVSVRSLNHRYLDVTLHVPRRLAFLEPAIKAAVQEHVRRGKVELWLRFSWPAGRVESVKVVPTVAGGVVAALRAIQDEHGLAGSVALSDVANFPGVIEVVDASLEGESLARTTVMELVRQALAGLNTMRGAEGRELEHELETLLGAVEDTARELGELSEKSKAERHEALLERVRGLREELGLEEGRFYQEVARLAERSDVAEELQRLTSHVAQFREFLGRGEAIGKRLDFLAQELMREANTIGSKAASAPMIQHVVALKSAIERLREQVQNVE